MPLNIGPCDEEKPIPPGTRCQEASIYSREQYIPCGGPAVAIVRHEKDRRSYYMCAGCTSHNLANRGGRLVRIMTDWKGLTANVAQGTYIID